MDPRFPPLRPQSPVPPADTRALPPGSVDLTLLAGVVLVFALAWA